MQEETRTELNRHAYAKLRRYTALWTALIVLLALLFIFVLWLTPVQIADNGMAPMIYSGDVILFDKLDKHFVSPKRGDIIAYRDSNGTPFIGRVIALPGETVELAAGNVYINGERLDESLYASGTCPDMPAITVPERAWLVLPDERAHADLSSDTLCISISNIIGRARLRVAPISEITIFTR